MTPEYKAINPTSTVPTLVDGDTKVFESNAIAIYMVEKYAKDDSLYPKDLKLRTKVNERLFYIASYIFPRGYQIFFPVFLGTETTISEQKLKEIHRGYETVETFLVGNEYLAGSTLTLCDIFGWNVMEAADRVIPLDATKFPNVIRWLTKMREHSEYPFVKDAADKHFTFYKFCLERNIKAASESA